MKIKLTYKQWKKVKKALKLVMLDPKVNHKGDIKHQYIAKFHEHRRYPRYHFETRFVHPDAHIIDIHIDWVQHTKSDGIHPLIDNYIEKIKQLTK